LTLYPTAVAVPVQALEETDGATTSRQAIRPVSCSSNLMESLALPVVTSSLLGRNC